MNCARKIRVGYSKIGILIYNTVKPWVTGERKEIQSELDVEVRKQMLLSGLKKLIEQKKTATNLALWKKDHGHES